MTEDQIAAAAAPYTAWANAFTPPELDQIVAIGDGLAQEEARIGDGEQLRSAVRVSRKAVFADMPATAAIYRKMEAFVRKVNDEVYQYDLSGFSEPFQYAVYEGSEGGHYDWHFDNALTKVVRKLSFSLQLSEPGSYEGGELEVYNGSLVPAPRERGTLIAFPSYALHRVTPVTRGTRRSLVIWMTGPRFR